MFELLMNLVAASFAALSTFAALAAAWNVSRIAWQLLVEWPLTARVMVLLEHFFHVPLRRNPLPMLLWIVALSAIAHAGAHFLVLLVEQLWHLLSLLAQSAFEAAAQALKPK